MIVTVLVIVAILVVRGDEEFDRSTFGVTRDGDGRVAVVVSPCEVSGIGWVEVGVGPEGERPTIVYSARLDDRSLAANEVALGAPPLGYEGTENPSELGADVVVWQLRTPEAEDLMPSPFRFDATALTPGVVLAGDGENVAIEEWRSC